jgi:hypothetical protein
MDATVVKGQIWPTRMRFATVWKSCMQHWFQNITDKELSVATRSLSHQIDDVESIDSLNNGQIIGRIRFQTAAPGHRSEAL